MPLSCGHNLKSTHTTRASVSIENITARRKRADLFSVLEGSVVVFTWIFRQQTTAYSRTIIRSDKKKPKAP